MSHKPELTWMDLLEYIVTLDGFQLMMPVVIQKSNTERYTITNDNMLAAMCNNCKHAHPVIHIGDLSKVVLMDDVVKKLVEDAHNELPPL